MRIPAVIDYLRFAYDKQFQIANEYIALRRSVTSSIDNRVRLRFKCRSRALTWALIECRARNDIDNNPGYADKSQIVRWIRAVTYVSLKVSFLRTTLHKYEVNSLHV